MISRLQQPFQQDVQALRHVFRKDNPFRIRFPGAEQPAEENPGIVNKLFRRILVSVPDRRSPAPPPALSVLFIIPHNK